MHIMLSVIPILAAIGLLSFIALKITDYKHKQLAVISLSVFIGQQQLGATLGVMQDETRHGVEERRYAFCYSMLRMTTVNCAQALIGTIRTVLGSKMKFLLKFKAPGPRSSAGIHKNVRRARC